MKSGESEEEKVISECIGESEVEEPVLVIINHTYPFLPATVLTKLIIRKCCNTAIHLLFHSLRIISFH